MNSVLPDASRCPAVSISHSIAWRSASARVRVRDVISGTATKKGIDEYLTLLSVAETCEFQKIDFLSFLRSGEKDIETFARGHSRNAKRKIVVSPK